jgi:hypothetical protein
MENIVNLYPVSRDANEARTLLPLALERAISSQQDDDDEDDELSDEDDKYASAISAIITDPRTPEYMASPLTTIMSNILNGEDGAVSRKFAKIGDCVAAVIESKDVPDDLKRPLENAALEMMNRLNQNGEMEAAWFRCFFDSAVKREAAKK